MSECDLEIITPTFYTLIERQQTDRYRRTVRQEEHLCKLAAAIIAATVITSAVVTAAASTITTAAAE